MARKTDTIGITGSAETIIGSGVSAKGTLVSESDITIDGTFSGEVKAAGNVTLGVNAQVKANISGDNITIAGQLEGNIVAGGETTISQTGKVKGDITTGLLAISSGAMFSGSTSMTQPESHNPLEDEPQAKD